MLYNRGDILGVVDLYAGNDRLINRGTIHDDVFMGDGNDFVDNRGGQVEGTIDLGSGANTFMPGASIETVVGGAGIDTLDFSHSSGVRLALDGSVIATGWAADDTYTGFENITGSNTGNDTLIGDGGANELHGGGGNDILVGLAGADTLLGGAGADTLTGGLGVDALSGGAGADKFMFAGTDLVGSSEAAGNFDVIYDFSHADGDKIDLSGIDANTALAKDQAFTFIGSAAFHHTAGELRYEAGSMGIYVLGDTNGDGVADFAIGLNQVASVIAGDFVL